MSHPLDLWPHGLLRGGNNGLRAPGIIQGMSPTLPPDAAPAVPPAPAYARPVPLDRASRLLNHGPTVLVGAAHGGFANVMAAAWTMPLDFEPPKLALVIDRTTRTRELIAASGWLVVSVPCVAQAALVTAVGSVSAHEQPDKLARHGVRLCAAPAPVPGATLPADTWLVDGCVAWLACAVIDGPAQREMQAVHDLYVVTVRAAWADERVFQGGRWHFEAADPALRTLHHVAGGHYYAVGEAVDAPAP